MYRIIIYELKFLLDSVRSYPKLNLVEVPSFVFITFGWRPAAGGLDAIKIPEIPHACLPLGVAMTIERTSRVTFLRYCCSVLTNC